MPWKPRVIRARRPWVAGMLAGAALLVFEASAHASEAPLAPVPAHEADEAPAEFRPLRATLELGTVFLVGSAYYITTSTEVPNWELNYDWDIFRRKISGEAFIADTNQFGTNFIGHPLGGAGYYLASRSNHGTVLQSSLFAWFGSLLWELFGEISSDVSLNDTIVTPLAGVSIGESTFQLGSFFDRSSNTTIHRTLGVLFGPFKSANDLMDGRADRRSTSRYPAREQHEFDLALGVATHRRSDGGSFDTTRVRAVERIARFMPYDASGEGSRWFHDGEMSGIDLDLAIGSQGLHDLRLETRAVLAGHSHHQVVNRAHGPWGAGGLIGLGTGFFYSIHDYLRGTGPKDRISGVHPLDAVFYHRLSLGSVSVVSRAEVGPVFVGARSLALDASSTPLLPDDAGLPLVLRARQYYFAAGVLGRTSLALRWKGLELGAESRVQTFDATDAPGETLDVRLTESERYSAETLSFAPSEPLRLRLFAEQRSRVGGLEHVTTQRRETAFGIAMGVRL